MMIQNVYVIGDIHGRFQPIRDFYQRNEEKINHTGRFNKENTLILLGDSGINYYLNERDARLKDKLKDYPFTYFVIRGNHEERASNLALKNPEAWHTEEYWGGQVLVENDFPHIKYASDYLAVYNIPYWTGDYINGEPEIKEYKTLTIPGAYSVDKDYRLMMGYAWFPDEQLTEKEKEEGLTILKENGYKYDLVLSHTCPCLFEPTDLFLPYIDQSIVDKSMERYLGHLEFAIEYNCWMWGHYHAFRDYPRTDGKKKIMLYNEVVNLNQVMDEDTVELL